MSDEKMKVGDLRRAIVSVLDDREIIIRVSTDGGDGQVMASLRSASAEFGCTDTEALMLDGEQDDLPAYPPRFPWMMAPLDTWSIVGMNHYYGPTLSPSPDSGKPRHLFVAMAKGGFVVKAEGPDEKVVFRKLVRDAVYYESLLADYRSKKAAKDS